MLARIIWSGGFLFSFLLSTASFAGEVLSVTPTGAVKAVHQITVRFSTDMVAMGDPKAAKDPFQLKCSGAGQKNEADGKTPAFSKRWADSKNWVIDFDQPLPAGVQCELKAQEIRDLKEEKVSSDPIYTLTTGGPAILTLAPMYGEIEPDQYFVVQTDAPVDRASVLQKAYFEVTGYPDKVLLRLIDGKEREDVIRAAVKTNWAWESLQKKIQETKNLSSLPMLENFLVIAANRKFPESAKVALHWPVGLRSKSGLPVAEPQTFSFQVLAPFEAKFTCERVSPGKPCNPITNISVEFKNSVSREQLKGAKLVSAKGQVWLPEELSEQKQAKRQEKEIATLTFTAPFPEKTSLQVILPKGIKDPLGRVLGNENKFPLSVTTDEYSPLVKFAATFGVLELNADPALPVSLRNVEKTLPQMQFSIDGNSMVLSGDNPAQVIKWYKAVKDKDWNYARRGESLLGNEKVQKLTLPKPSTEREFELVGIPLKKPGFYIVELESPRLGEALLGAKIPMYVASSALVTNLSVHFKRGRTRSLVWVTRLDTAAPVEGADISLFNDQGKSLAKGKTGKGGVLWLDSIAPACPDVPADSDESGTDHCEIFSFAKLGDDFTFASSNWSQGIESYRFNLQRDYVSPQWGATLAHTVFDRPLMKAGETIHFKHFLREHTQNGFRALRSQVLPKRVLVVHEGTQKVYALPFEYDAATGTALNTFTLPKDASLGLYSVYLSNRAAAPKGSQNGEQGENENAFDWSAKATGTFVVSEYRLPLMNANVKISGKTLVQPKEVPVDLSAQYLSGGPAKGLKVKVRSSIRTGYFAPEVPGSNQFTFFSEPLKVGVQNYSEQPETVSEDNFLKVQELTLKEDGGQTTSIQGLPAIKKVSDLLVEMEYHDPNGEVKTASTQKTLFPANYIVGLGSENWIAKPGQVQAQGVITGVDGKPLKARPYTVEAFQTEFLTHRKRLVGGFYSYDYKSTVKSLGVVCQGQSDSNGRFQCDGKNLPTGSITLQAKVTDEAGRSTYASTSMEVYAAGGNSWWVPTDSDRIDLLPEKIRYEPGETAKLVVRSPFPVATALITVEREGVMDAFVKEIKRDQPVIEIPLKGNYAPNVFVSAMLVRGRVGEPQATALLDLARPAMKLGMTELRVGWKAHELKVSLKTDKQKYRARDKALVTIAVKTASGAALPAGSEVAVAAVDEALLQLRSNQSWYLLQSMMGQRGLEVDTSSAQNQIIGRRHFGAKAKPPGGGGGLLNGGNRELFDPMLLWQPRLKLDANGEAKITVPLNDSITSFRIAAIANGGMDFFGDGSTKIESSKDLILYSGFAPVVREGDSIESEVTLRNTTAKTMKVGLSFTSPQLAKVASPAALELGANSAKTVRLPLQIPDGVKAITYQLSAKDEISGVIDNLKSEIKVSPAVPMQVQQATLLQLEKPTDIPVRQPPQALPGKGEIQIHAQDTLVRGLAGVRAYMEDYPYTCLEQKISRSIVLEEKQATEKLIQELPSYMDANGLLKFFPLSICGSAQLSRYVVDILHTNEFQIPDETLNKILNGIKLELNGTHACHAWWNEKDKSRFENEERILLMETLSRFQNLKIEDVTAIPFTPNLWKTETVVAYLAILKALPDIPKQAELVKQALNILHSRMNFQGSLMNFQNGTDWEGRYRLFTSEDQQALGVFSVALLEPSWSPDVGRMVRGLVARLHLGVWDTTMANAWGVTWMRIFSSKFEKEAVTGETKISGGAEQEKIIWAKTPKGDSKSLAWPKGSDKAPVPINLTHAGTGKPWIHLETLSAIPLKAPVDLGYKVTRKVTPI